MSGPRLERAANGVWYVHWTEGRRSRRLSTREKDLDAAKGFFGTWLLMEREAPREAANLYTCADLWALYAEKHVESKTAAPATARFSWQNLQQHFGGATLAEIDQDTVDRYVAKRQAGRIGRPSKPATVRRELVALRACLNWCAEPKRRLILPAQVPAFDLPAAGEPKDRWLRHDELQRLMTAAATLRTGDRLHRGELFLWLALETAGRKTALLQLTWDRVDFETGVIHLPVPGARRTKKRRADVPMSSALRPVLERAWRERTSALVLGHAGDVWATVQSIAERAGFGPESRPPRRNGAKPRRTGISPHVLRHTAATHMARRGVPLWHIAKVLGNTLAMVERVYAKHSPDDLRVAVDMISGGRVEAAE